MIKKLVIYWLPVVLWMGLIYFLSSFHKLQASPVGWQDFIVRKTAHFLEYAILFVLTCRGLNFTSGMSFRKKLLTSLIVTILYALSDEFHQTKVNGRTGKFLDIWVDSLGAIGGLLFVWKLIKLLPERVQNFFIAK